MAQCHGAPTIMGLMRALNRAHCLRNRYGHFLFDPFSSSCSFFLFFIIFSFFLLSRSPVPSLTREKRPVPFPSGICFDLLTYFYRYTIYTYAYTFVRARRVRLCLCKQVCIVSSSPFYFAFLFPPFLVFYFVVLPYRR